MTEDLHLRLPEMPERKLKYLIKSTWSIAVLKRYISRWLDEPEENIEILCCNNKTKNED